MEPLKFNDKVFGFKEERDPYQRPSNPMDEKSYVKGTAMVPYKGEIIGIRNMVNGDVFYTLEATEINIFGRRFPVNSWEHKRQVEVFLEDICFSEDELKEKIKIKVDEFVIYARKRLEEINMNKFIPKV